MLRWFKNEIMRTWMSIFFQYHSGHLSVSTNPVFHNEKNDADERNRDGEHRSQLHHEKPCEIKKKTLK